MTAELARADVAPIGTPERVTESGMDPKYFPSHDVRALIIKVAALEAQVAEIVRALTTPMSREDVVDAITTAMTKHFGTTTGMTRT
jgi:hypothetical protein